MPRKAGRGHPIIPRETLQRELAQGRSLRDIARRYHVSRRAVQKRVARLKATNAIIAVAHPPHQEQSARQQMHALDLFLDMVATKRKMLRAYERMAEDPDQPGEYCMDPTTKEIFVIYREEIIDEDGKSHWVKRRENLNKLMSEIEEYKGIEVLKTEHKGADWRVEMRHLTTEIGNQMTQGAELKALMSSTESFQAFMQALQEAIDAASPEVGRRIARAVAHKLMVILPDPQQRQAAGV